MKTLAAGFRLYIWIVLVSVISGLAWTPRPAFAAWTVGAPIVTYYAGPQLTYANTQQMAEGGWNLVWANSVAQLDVAQDQGLRAMWTGSLDDATISQIRTHPALYSYYLIDEPSAAQFPALASTVAHLRTLDPNRMTYINLFPNYASNGQLGTNGYQQYLSQYMSTVHPSLLSYDHYQFYTNRDAPDYFKNLAIISHTAKQGGIPFLNIVQACSWDPAIRVPTTNELRYLTYTTLAYGGQGVSHFVYSAPGFTLGGGMIHADGTPTPLYSAAKSINPQFESIARQVQSLHWIGAYHLGDLPWGFGTSDGSSPMRLPANSPFSISPSVANSDYVTNAPVRGMLMGFFGAADQLLNATCALVVNLNYEEGIRKLVTGPGNLSVFNPATGLWSATGQTSALVTLEPGGGALVALTSAIPVSPPPTWNVNSGGNWLMRGNWSTGTVPNSIDAEVHFYGAITSAHTVYSEAPIVAGKLGFNNSNQYVLSGTASLTLQVSTGSAAIDVQSGSHKINLPLTIASNTNLSVATGATLTIGNPVTIKAGRTVNRIGNVIIQAPLTIETGGALNVGPGPAAVLFGAPSLAVGARVNVQNNSVIVEYPGIAGPAATIQHQLTTGYNNGLWNGNGICTSSAIAGETGLGWKDNAATQSILVKYTYYGDTNLDGQVDIVDLGALATHWQTSAVWSGGDFNYDGVVDISDLGLLASNWQRGVGTPLAPSFDQALAAIGLPGATVPEPSMIGASLGVAGLFRRRCSRWRPPASTATPQR